MIIKCWGSRGSIPVSGRQYIKYGGDTTCLEIRTKDDDIIIVDAGTGIRRLGTKLIKEDRYEYNFIITHAHWDHLMGFPFFKPLYFPKTKIHMHRCPFPSKYVKNMLSKLMAPPNFPVRYNDLTASIYYEEDDKNKFNIGSVTVIPIAISHPNTGSGYKFIEDGKIFIFLTDNELRFVHPKGLAFDDYVKFAKDADLLFHDGEYTLDEYKTKVEWGHSSYKDAIELAMDASVKKLGLFHLNQERTDTQVDSIIKKSNKIIKDSNENLECFAVAADMVFEL